MADPRPRISTTTRVGRCIALCAVLLTVSVVGNADEEAAPRFRLHGLVDLRGAITDKERSWLERGSGKLRYGGDGEDGTILGRLSEFSLVGTARFTPDLFGALQLQHRSDQTKGIDLVQAFLRGRRQLTDELGLSLKAGFFFPPISLEHDRNLAWTTEYSITPSAINSWIGEEVRTAGLEADLIYKLGDQTRLVGTLALFGGNDPAGSILSWRGWALHDIKSGLREQLPLAPLPVLEPDSIFDGNQAPYDEPFNEIDDRPGMYGGVTLQHKGHQLRFLYYDNNADESVVEHGQYAWDTSFSSAGLRLSLPLRSELDAQWMSGTTKMGEKANGANKLHDDFRSWYLLLTSSAGRHRLTLRYDWFEVEDTNGRRYGYDDDRGETWTLAYNLETFDDQLLQLEWLRVRSEKNVRPQLGLPKDFDETLWQANYRIRF